MAHRRRRLGTNAHDAHDECVPLVLRRLRPHVHRKDVQNEVLRLLSNGINHFLSFLFLRNLYK